MRHSLYTSQHMLYVSYEGGHAAYHGAQLRRKDECFVVNKVKLLQSENCHSGHSIIHCEKHVEDYIALIIERMVTASHMSSTDEPVMALPHRVC